MKHNSDTAALNELLSTLNNPDIVGVTPVDQRDEVDKAHPGPKIETTKSPPIETSLPEPPLLKEAWVAPLKKLPPPAPLPPGSTPHGWLLPREAYIAPVQKLFFTGRLKSGKDYAAAAAGATIFGFADPLYAIALHCFNTVVSGTVGKDLPGIREFLQTVGQWGRAVVNAQYPLTVARAVFTDFVRNQMPAVYGDNIVWSEYGRNPDIWLNCCIARVDDYLSAAPPEKRVAITNCRFDNEFKRLTAEGYQHWHVMVSPGTWAKRLTASKLTMDSPAVKDLSEQLASNLDSNVTKQISAAKQGPKLRAIWNDDAPQPSTRLHSLATFLQSIKGV